MENLREFKQKEFMDIKIHDVNNWYNQSVETVNKGCCAAFSTAMAEFRLRQPNENLDVFFNTIQRRFYDLLQYQINFNTMCQQATPELAFTQLLNSFGLTNSGVGYPTKEYSYDKGNCSLLLIHAKPIGHIMTIMKEVKKIYFFDPNYGVASFENLSEFDQKITEHIVKNYKDYDKLEMLDVKL